MIGVDETSFQKRREYVTVVNDLETPRVLHVADDRTTSALDGFYAVLGPEGCARLETIAMDMWEAYIGSTRRHVLDADRKSVRRDGTCLMQIARSRSTNSTWPST